MVRPDAGAFREEEEGDRKRVKVEAVPEQRPDRVLTAAEVEGARREAEAIA